MLYVKNTLNLRAEANTEATNRLEQNSALPNSSSKLSLEDGVLGFIYDVYVEAWTRYISQSVTRKLKDIFSYFYVDVVAEIF